MSTSNVVKGTVLFLNGNTLTIFGNSGFVHGKSWVMNFGFNIEVTPQPASPEIISVINSDIENGNLEKIACIQVNPNTALRLFLEGTIGREDIERAVVFSESIIFNNIVFATIAGVKPFSIVVVPDPKHKIATLDKEGDIV